MVRELERFSPDESIDRLLRHVHRGLGAMLGADLGFVWRLGRGLEIEATYHWVWTKQGEVLREQTPPSKIQAKAVRFAKDRVSPDEPSLLLTPVEIGGLPIGVLAFLRPARRFSRPDAGLATDAAEFLGRQLEHREREKLFQTRERIVRKVLLQHRPADILYQILHGLKRLLRYDHSASVHTFDLEGRTVTTRAEVIAWAKGRSLRIGKKVPLDAESIEAIRRCEHCIPIDPTVPTEEIPPSLMDHLANVAPDAPRPRSLLLAPLRRLDEPVGILAIRANAPDAFVDADRRTIDSFSPIVTATALHSEFFRHQQDLLLEAERRTALGDLARAISHDLSNAFGVIQPLLDTLRRDAVGGTLTSEHLLEDLDTLRQYVGTSLRIFHGLLSFATGSVEGAHLIRIEECLDSVLSLLDRSLKAQRIEVTKEIPDHVPRLLARRPHIEQLFLNLMTNARESMPVGGSMMIRLWIEETTGNRDLRISIADSGKGIPSELLERVFEPFFTTKTGGTGIGLDICRSIVWEYEGALWLESDVGKGTTAHVRLPYRDQTKPNPEVKE